MPKKFILDPVNGWQQWASFFPCEVSEQDVEAGGDYQSRSYEEAVANCEAAYQAFLQLAVSNQTREREAEVAAISPVADAAQSPAADSGEPAATEETPEHLATPKRVIRRKPGTN